MKTKTQIRKYKGANLHSGQLEIIKDILHNDYFYHTICCGRGFGKSFFIVQLILYYALNNTNTETLFASPTYKQSMKVFNDLLKGVDGSDVIKNKNKQDNTIEFINGSLIRFVSTQQPDNIVGYHIDYMFLDEAALYKEELFNRVFRPMLAIRGKKCFLFSTPRGKNWFYEIFMQYKTSDRYYSYTASSDKNPFFNREEIEDARKVLPNSIFRQEYLGEFIDDGGDVFSCIGQCINNKLMNYIPNEVYYCGIDLGRQGDWTVLTMLNSKCELVYKYRIQHQEWPFIVDNLAMILNKYRPRCTLLEANGIGDVIYSTLKQKYSNITPFETNVNSKPDIIEKLIMAFQENTISICSKEEYSELFDELSDFTFSYSKQKRAIQYHARTGHDDCVMSLAICHEAFKTGKTKGVYTFR